MEEQLNDLIKEVHETSIEKGFFIPGEKRNFAEMIALVHGELSEALEEYRKSPNNLFITYHDNKKPLGVASELADVIIYILAISGHYNIDLAPVLLEKIQYNKTRPYLHGKTPI